METNILFENESWKLFIHSEFDRVPVTPELNQDHVHYFMGKCSLLERVLARGHVQLACGHVQLARRIQYKLTLKATSAT